MFLAKTTIFALVVAAAFVEGSPVNSDNAELTPNLPDSRIFVDTNDERIQQLATFSLSELQSFLRISKKPQIVKVTEAYKQIIAGISYKITYDVSLPNGGKKSCTVKLWENSWTSPDPKVTDVACDGIPSNGGKPSTIVVTDY